MCVDRPAAVVGLRDAGELQVASEVSSSPFGTALFRVPAPARVFVPTAAGFRSSHIDRDQNTYTDTCARLGLLIVSEPPISNTSVKLSACALYVFLPP